MMDEEKDTPFYIQTKNFRVVFHPENQLVRIVSNYDQECIFFEGADLLELIKLLEAVDVSVPF